MTFDEFYRIYAGRIDAYVKRYSRAVRAPDGLDDDLRQACYLAAFRVLPYWKDMKGGLSAFNWCAAPMKAAMEKTLRSSLGYKPSGKAPLKRITGEYIEGCHEANNGLSFEETYDLKRILSADKKPQHVLRFIALALSPRSGAELARDSGISRQAIFLANAKTRKRLRMAMG